MPTVVDLLFRQAPNPTTQPVELLFGQLEELPDQGVRISGALPGLQGTILAGKATRGIVVTGALPGLEGRVRIGAPRVVSLSGSLPSLGGRIVVGDPTTVAVVGALPGLGGVATVRFNVNVDRPVVGEVGSTWQHARRASMSVEDRQQRPARLQPGVATRWTAAVPVRPGIESLKPRSLMPVRVSGEALRTPTLVPARVLVQSLFEDAIRIRRPVDAGYEEAEARRAEWASAYQDRVRLRSAATDALQAAVPLRRLIEHLQSSAVPVRLSRSSWWQEAMVPPPGWGWRPPVPPDPDPCYLPDPHLVFASAAAVDGNLVFICDRHPGPGPQEPIIVPVRRIYMVHNNFSLVRVSDGQAVLTDAFRISLDVDSWAWDFSASVPAHMLSLVEPTSDGPVELLATINGTPFHLLAEQVGRTREFRSNAVRVQGRGRIAELHDDYAPQLTFGNATARTAQQLMADALTMNGVPLDWAVEWGLEDWLVPAGVWSHQGSYISALNAIAKAAGGYLLPHSSAKSVKVLHRYPVAPWDWAGVTPDLVLPANVARRDGKSWASRPAYNRVFVAPQNTGLTGYQVTREGTAGDLAAPLIVDPLMTDVAAVRQRARAELGQGGRRIDLDLVVPVLAETGIVLPGTFVDYVDDLGHVRGPTRSVSVDCVFPNIWQTLGVETRA